MFNDTLANLKEQRKKILTQKKITKKEKIQIIELEKLIENIEELNIILENEAYKQLARSKSVKANFLNFNKQNQDFIEIFKKQIEYFNFDYDNIIKDKNFISNIIDMEINLNIFKNLIDSTLYKDLKQKKLELTGKMKI